MAFGSMHDHDDAPMSDINVTPLVDVMLVLLIVFMITMPVLTHSISIDLPNSNQTSAVQPNKDTQYVEIAVDAQGNYVIGSESTQFLDESALQNQLAALYQQDKDRIIAINADRHVPYEKVAKLLEMAQNIGFNKVGFRFEVEKATQ